MKSATVGTLLYWMYTDGNLPFFPDIDKVNICSFLSYCFVHLVILFMRIRFFRSIYRASRIRGTQ